MKNKSKFREVIGYTNVKIDKESFFESVEIHELNIRYSLDDMYFIEDVQILEQKGNDIIVRVDRRIKHWFDDRFS